MDNEKYIKLMQNFNKKIEELQVKNIELEKKLIEKGNENYIIIEEMNKIIQKDKNYEMKIKELEEKLQYYKKKCNKQKINLKKMEPIKQFDNLVYLISLFPSGNLLTVIFQKTIKIYNINYEILQIIENKEEISIIEIKDENNFISCSNIQSINIYKKNKTIFELCFKINKAHDEPIIKIIYTTKFDLISCSWDNRIKIWEYQNNKYECITNISSLNYIISILLLEDKNILISSGERFVKFFNYNNLEILFNIENIFCSGKDALKRFNKDIIMVGTNLGNLKLISLAKKQIIKEIKIDFFCWFINIFEEKDIFLIGGNSNKIMIFDCDNFNLIKTIIDDDFKDIINFIQLKNNYIISNNIFGKYKIWEFNYEISS